MEIEQPAITVIVSYQCDVCKTGYMEPHGNIMLLNDPPMYAHECNNKECRASQNLLYRYPTYKVVPV